MSNTRTNRTPATSGRVKTGDAPADTEAFQQGMERQTSPGFVEGLSDAVRNNPASAALIGIGAAWLLMGGANVSLLAKGTKMNKLRLNRSARNNADHHFAGESAASSVSSSPRAAGSDNAASSAASSAAPTVRSAGEGLKSTASATAAHGSSGPSAVQEGLGSVIGQADDAASRAGSSAYGASTAAARGVYREAENLQQTLGEFFEDKPLALGILGLAIGAGIAAALPRTATEQRFMGEASDAAKEQAGSIAAAKLDEVKAAASEIFDQVSGEVETQGLTKDGLAAAAQTMGHKLSTVADVAVKSVKNEVASRGSGSGQKSD